MTEAVKPLVTKYVAIAPAHGYWSSDKECAMTAIRNLILRVGRSNRKEDLHVFLYGTGDEFEIEDGGIASKPLKVMGDKKIPHKLIKPFVKAWSELDGNIYDQWEDNLYALGKPGDAKGQE